jgi:hypothetical protein
MLPTENLSKDTVAVADSLSAMIEKELTTYSCEGYLDPSDPTMITFADRLALVDWCYAVVDKCRFSREAVALAMHMVDRFLSIPSSIADETLHDPDKFQLLIVTSLYVVIKVNEKVVVGSKFFSDMSRGSYTAEDIEDMERKLLSGLSWRCHAPTAFQVGFHILSLILPKVNIPEATWAFVMDEMRYQNEHAVRDYYFSTQRASTIALAAIMNASSVLDSQHRQDFLTSLSSIFVNFSFEEIDRLLVHKKKLASLIIEGADATKDDDEGDKEAEEVTLIAMTSNNHFHNPLTIERIRSELDQSPSFVNEVIC